MPQTRGDNWLLSTHIGYASAINEVCRLYDERIQTK